MIVLNECMTWLELKPQLLPECAGVKLLYVSLLVPFAIFGFSGMKWSNKFVLPV